MNKSCKTIVTLFTFKGKRSSTCREAVVMYLDLVEKERESFVCQNEIHETVAISEYLRPELLLLQMHQLMLVDFI